MAQVDVRSQHDRPGQKSPVRHDFLCDAGGMAGIDRGANGRRAVECAVAARAVRGDVEGPRRKGRWLDAAKNGVRVTPKVWRRRARRPACERAERGSAARAQERAPTNWAHGSEV